MTAVYPLDSVWITSPGMFAVEMHDDTPNKPYTSVATGHGQQLQHKSPQLLTY